MTAATKLDREPGRQAVAYFRVSTQRQGASGLGLEAQRESVETYARAAGLSIVESFTEIETGTRKKNRPEIAKAVKEAKARRAVLLIAKIDRLARDVGFVDGLMKADVDFVAVDMPDANRLTVHIIAALAEHEARLISVRTRDALAAAKRRGTKLGRPEALSGPMGAAGRKLGQESNREKAREESRQAAALARVLHMGGASLREIARRLNEAGHTTRTGKPWGPVQVSRMLERCADVA